MQARRTEPVKRRSRVSPAKRKAKSKSPTKRRGSPVKSPKSTPVKNPEKIRRDTPYKPRDIPYIGTQKEAPEWMRYNEFILYGYRINFTTKWRAFKSLFILNNQSFNVWSHFGAAIFFIFMTYWTYFNLSPPIQYEIDENSIFYNWPSEHIDLTYDHLDQLFNTEELS